MVRTNRVGGSSPSYKHCLAMLGQYLNQQHARLATVAEVDIGFMVFYYPGGNVQKQRTLMVPYTDLLELNGEFAAAARGRKGGILHGGSARDKRHPLLPQGYDTVFRALGHKLDQRQAICITICEARGTLYLDYWVDKATFVIRDQRRQAVSHHQGETFDAAGVAKIVELTRDGLAQESRRHLNALRVNPHDHLSTLAAAFVLEDEGNYRDAESFFSRIVSQVPHHPEAQYHVARLAYMRGDDRAALHALRQALGLRDDIAAFHDLRGRILLRQRKLKDTVAAFEQATLQDPENPIIHAHLAAAYEAQGRKEDAAHERALIAQPHAAPAWEMVREDLLADYTPVSVTDDPDEHPAQAGPAGMVGSLAAAEALLPPLPPEEHGRTAGQGPVPDAWPGFLPGADAPLAAQSQRIAPADPSPSAASDPAAAWSAPRVADYELPILQEASPAAVPWLTTFPAGPGDAPFDRAPAQPAPTLAMRLSAAQAGGPEAPSASLPPAVSDEIPIPASPLPSPDDAGTVEPVPSMAFGGASMPASTAAPASGAVSPPSAATTGAVPSFAPAPLESASLALSASGAPPASISLDARPVDPGMAGARAGQPLPGIGDAAQEPPPDQGAVQIAAEILTIQRALEAEPDRADLHRKLGFLLARQGRTAEAATEFRRALECSRTSL